MGLVLENRTEHPPNVAIMTMAARSTSKINLRKSARTPVAIPARAPNAEIEVGDRKVRLTNLQKTFWPELGITKGQLLQYYADVAWALLPHIADRPMVMKRYPNGAAGDFFFMKRSPSPRPEWIRTCDVEHESGDVIDFPVIDDVASLLWVVNLGCIDLNPWYSRCDDIHKPDVLHFDIDPGEASFEDVVAAAQIVREALVGLKMPVHVKTSGSKGLHLYVPIVRSMVQHDVWNIAKTAAHHLASQHPKLLTAEYTIAKRPKGRVLLDYNQNSWGRTLASVYSVRPTKGATISMPVHWDELEAGARIEDFTLRNAPARLKVKGDLWGPMAPAAKRRFDLTRLA